MQFLFLAGELEHGIWGSSAPPSWPPMCDKKHVLVIFGGTKLFRNGVWPTQNTGIFQDIR